MKRGAGTLEPWSTKEKLCLSSAVLRSGDQNWMSVSRQLRVFGEQDRPPEWYSQKQCALQYESLLNNVGTSKRKKRSEKGVETVDSPGESIVRRLMQERLEELRFLIEQDKKDYMRIKKEMEEIESGKADDRLDEFEREIEEEMEREAARASILRQHEERSRLEGRVTPHPPPPSENILEQPETKVPTSPLLTSLLQSPTSYRGAMHNLLTPTPPLSRVNDSPTLSRLLESPAKQLEPTKLFTSPVKKEPIEEEPCQTLETDQTADPLPIVTDGISEAIEEVQTHSPLLVEIKKETIEEKEELTNDLAKSGGTTEDVPEAQIQEEVEIVLHAEEEFRSAPTPTTKTEIEETDGEKEDQEHSSLTNLQDSDTMEEQSMTELDRQMVNMIVAGGGVISVSHDTSSEHLEEVTSSDIQHKEDSETAESVKEDSLDDEIVKEGEATETRNVEAESCQTVEVDVLNNFIIGPETPKDNYVVQLLCSTPENVLEEETKTTEVKEPQNTNNKKERSTSIGVLEEMEGAVLEVGGEMVNLGGAVVIEEEADTTVHEVEVLVSELNTAPSSSKTAEEEDSTSTQDVDMKDVVESPDTEANDESQDEIDVPTPKTSLKDENVREDKEEDKSYKEPPVTSSKTIEGKAESPITVEEDSEGGGKRPNKRRLISGSDSKPSSPACHMIEDTKEYRSWKKSIMLVFNRMATHKYASMFLRPITNEQAPAYDTVIHRPIDLSTIKKRIESGELRTTVEFQRDLLLMFQNAIMYNNSRSLVYKMASIMQNECLQHIELMVEAMGEGVPWRKDPVSVDKLNTRGRGEAPKRKRVSLEDKSGGPLKIKKEPIN